VFFRIFDIIKPPPAKQWESYRRGWGVMADDLAAGFYAACLLQIALAILGKWGINFL
jgi:phosphatidylglycerophosphatase A